LACAHENQPYIVPLYFAYDGDYLYSFSTRGQKIEWMRSNPNVCVEVDEVASPQRWVSVVVFGQYEEMPDVPEWRGAREYARKKLLQRNAIWWEPAYARTIQRDTERPLAPSFYRIRIVQITGHRATHEHPTPRMPLPAHRIAELIDGRDTIRAHGTRDMPVWGERLYEVGESNKGEVGIGEVITKIIDYLDTIQDRRTAMR